jgi:hypothetical protein
MKLAESRWTRCESHGCFALRYPGQRFCYKHWILRGTIDTALLVIGIVAFAWWLSWAWGW